jgi:hypothetical protein
MEQDDKERDIETGIGKPRDAERELQEQLRIGRKFMAQYRDVFRSLAELSRNNH